MSISDREIRHSTCVSVNGVGILIVGPSGSGKSTLAIKLIALGAFLVGDDRCLLIRDERGITVERPPNLPMGIEARGIGILGADYVGPTLLALAVDLDNTEPARLPNHYTFARFGVRVPLLKRVPDPHFVPAILQFLSHGRIA